MIIATTLFIAIILLASALAFMALNENRKASTLRNKLLISRANESSFRLSSKKHRKWWEEAVADRKAIEAKLEDLKKKAEDEIRTKRNKIRSLRDKNTEMTFKLKVNKNAHPNANPRYVRTIQNGVCYLFTEHQTADAAKRAIKNEEDCQCEKD